MSTAKRILDVAGAVAGLAVFAPAMRGVPSGRGRSRRNDVERLGWTHPDTDFRWTVKPGLTGVAQLLGATSAAEALEHDRDRAYIARPALALDLACISLSFAVNALGKGRVRAWMRTVRAAVAA